MKTLPRLMLLPMAFGICGLTSCTSLLHENGVTVRPAENLSALVQRDPLYESAVTAINARDYGRALEYLHEARARDPRNVKALNALGVVYDKLGRFDLSARYYAEARSVDPNSRILAQNMEYSKSLQGLAGAGSKEAEAIAPPVAVTANSPTVQSQPVKMTDVEPQAWSEPASLAGDSRTESIETKSIALNAGVPPKSAEIGSATNVKLDAVTAEKTQPVDKLVLDAKLSSLPVVMAVPTVVHGPTALKDVGSADLKQLEALNSTNEALISKAAMPAVPAAREDIREASRIPAVSRAVSPKAVSKETKAASLPSGSSAPNVSTQAVKVAAPTKKVLTIGEPMRLINATGQGLYTVQRRLKSLGWTVRASEAQTQQATILFFRTKFIATAKALQLTLPFPVRLVPEQNSSAMRLIVGRDYLGWRPKSTRLALLWKKDVAVASLQKMPGRGGH